MRIQNANNNKRKFRIQKTSELLIVREQHKIHGLHKARQQLRKVGSYLRKYDDVSRWGSVQHFNKKQDFGRNNRYVHEQLQHQVFDSLLVNVESKLVHAKSVMNKEINDHFEQRQRTQRYHRDHDTHGKKKKYNIDQYNLKRYSNEIWTQNRNYIYKKKKQNCYRAVRNIQGLINQSVTTIT